MDIVALNSNRVLYPVPDILGETLQYIYTYVHVLVCTVHTYVHWYVQYTCTCVGEYSTYVHNMLASTVHMYMCW